MLRWSVPHVGHRFLPLKPIAGCYFGVVVVIDLYIVLTPYIDLFMINKLSMFIFPYGNI